MVQVVDLLDMDPDRPILVDLPLVIMDLITMDLTILQATHLVQDNILQVDLQDLMDHQVDLQEVLVQKTVITIPQVDLDTNQ